MVRYILKRILIFIPVLLTVAVVIFTIMYFTPGDPVAMLMHEATEQEIETRRTSLGLNDTYIVQLFRFLKESFLYFDLGESYVNKRSVMVEIIARLPRTSLLAAFVIFFQIVLGIPLGITAAIHQNKWQDHLCMVMAMIGIAIPDFWLALLLMLLFALRLGLLPTYGIGSWQHFLLPVIVLGLKYIGGVARMMRSQMLEVIRSDYMLTARIKGLTEREIRYKHAVPNSLIPVVTNIGQAFGRALGGAIIIETVFSIPGIGLYMAQAIGNRDYPVIRGSVLVLALLFCTVMLLLDLLYAFIDPRIKAQYERRRTRRKIQHA
jgi:ABC-type dipeptide/oligopeptide/nickel transport system permease component